MDDKLFIEHMRNEFVRLWVYCANTGYSIKITPKQPIAKLDLLQELAITRGITNKCPACAVDSLLALRKYGTIELARKHACNFCPCVWISNGSKIGITCESQGTQYYNWKRAYSSEKKKMFAKEVLNSWKYEKED